MEFKSEASKCNKEKAQPYICGWNRKGPILHVPLPPHAWNGQRLETDGLLTLSFNREGIKLLRLAFLPTGYLMGGAGAPSSVPATY